LTVTSHCGAICAKFCLSNRCGITGKNYIFQYGVSSPYWILKCWVLVHPFSNDGQKQRYTTWRPPTSFNAKVLSFGGWIFVKGFAQLQ